MAKWDLEKLKQPSPEAIDAHALVRAALERAAEKAANKLEPKHFYTEAQSVSDAIRAIASNPTELAAIISAASQLNKAGDGNKERSDEEDRG